MLKVIMLRFPSWSRFFYLNLRKGGSKRLFLNLSGFNWFQFQIICSTFQRHSLPTPTVSSHPLSAKSVFCKVNMMMQLGTGSAKRGFVFTCLGESFISWQPLTILPNGAHTVSLAVSTFLQAPCRSAVRVSGKLSCLPPWKPNAWDRCWWEGMWFIPVPETWEDSGLLFWKTILTSPCRLGFLIRKERDRRTKRSGGGGCGRAGSALAGPSIDL